MKKALGQTVRDIKRGVNKKVLKVPSIEQKVLDATSNEPWGPHGSLLADIAQASKNYHEYQMIMSVIWKRINDTGKNWRHVYKALTVLEYLVAHGSERCIDDIREHAYQISTLSDFQYIDSSGRDQGNNVRKKSQSLVVLVNDKESIQEVRQKAASNKDKYRGSAHSRAGSMSSSGGYGDRSDDDRYEGRYGNRDDHNASGRERDWSTRDDDRNGRHGDTYGREGDKNGRYSEERYGREGYRDSDYQGRSQSIDDHHYGSRSRSADRYRDRDFEDDGQYSSRGNVAKADDHSQDGSTSTRLERKYSEQNLGAPPNYEEVVGTNRSPTYNERDRESTLASAPKASSPTGTSPSHIAATFPPPVPASPPAPTPAQNSNKEVDGFDEFDPRGSFSANSAISDGFAPATSGGTEMNLLGSLSESFPPNSLALVPVIEPTMTPEANAPVNFSSAPTLAPSASAPTIFNQPFDDPFGDGPFKATPSTDYMSSGPSGVQPPLTNPQFSQMDISTPNQDFDILADILPQSAPSSFVNTQSGYPVPPGHSVSHNGFPPQTNEAISQFGPQAVNAPQNSFPAQSNHSSGFFAQPGQPSLPTSYPLQSAESVPHNSFLALTYPVQAAQASQIGVHYQNGQAGAIGWPSQMGFPQAGVQAPLAQPNPPTSNFYGAYHSQSPAGINAVPPSSSGPVMNQNFLSQSGFTIPIASTGSSAIVSQQSKDQFKTKSTVWADTLSRGLVNLNISGSKTNPLSDIGVDFDALNRKEKRMAKPTTEAVTSTITMGKAMGSGSGIDRAGAGVIRPPQNPMVSPGMGGYGINQQGRGMNMPGNMGMGMNMPGNMGMGLNMPGNMGVGINMPGNMGMNTGMGQSMLQPTGFPPGGYNPMRGAGNYGQNPYGGGYQ